MIISEKLSFSIKTNMCQSIKSYLIDLKQSLLFLVEDIIKVNKHKTQKENQCFWFSQKMKKIVSVKNWDDVVKTL